MPKIQIGQRRMSEFQEGGMSSGLADGLGPNHSKEIGVNLAQKCLGLDGA
jgi:hypothetical protein